MSQSILPNRRTQSVDEYGYQIENNEHDGIDEKYRKKILHNGKREITKQISDDDYVCALLPRTNNRPSAKTCW
jgi:hypothetical protein